jgi:replicative DNA helicase
MVQAFNDNPPRRLRATQPAGLRVPPNDTDAEKSLLGAMLLSPDAISVALEQCHADDFYHPTHGNLFEAMTRLYERGEAVDAVTVTDELRRSMGPESVIDPVELLSMQSSTPSSANASHYAEIVREMATLRRLISVSGEIADLAYSAPGDVIAVVDEAEQKMLEVSDRRKADTLRAISPLLEESLSRIQELAETSQTITGTPTGYKELDKILGGLQPEALCIVGARPAMGKTSFALGILSHVGVVERRPALLFSLEMSHLELTQRLLSSEAKVDAAKMKVGRLNDTDWARVSNAVTKFSEAPIYIDDNPHLTVMEIRARARRLKKQHGELGVIALSQLSRGLEARQDKRPMLSDLRESGSLEQDADVVLFLYREEKYDQDCAPDRKGIAEVIVSKNRNGPTATADLAFISNYARFDNMGNYGL